MKLVRSVAPLTVLVAVLCTTGHSQTTTLVSIGLDGLPVDTGVYSASISADARFVAFSSDATNLVPGHSPGGVRGAYHLYVRDRVTNVTTQVDVDSNGSPSAGSSYSSTSSLSSDGRFVAFASEARDLVSDDVNDFSDIFVHDRVTGETTRVDIDSFGAPANRVSYYPSISGDGRFVAFVSEASNLVPGDTNGFADVFVHDRATRRTIRVSVDSNGAQANLYARNPVISADGRCVAFESYASNLVAGDTNGLFDVFVRDLSTGRTERVSVSSSGSQGTVGWETALGSTAPAISADGRFVAFLSDASGLDRSSYYTFVGWRGFFVHDRVTGATTRASVSSAGLPASSGYIYPYDRPSISADGRYVAFASVDHTLATDDLNFTSDIFVHDVRSGITTLQSRSSSGAVGNAISIDPMLSADGTFIVFRSGATNLVDEPTSGGVAQVFVRGRLGRDLIETYCYGDSTTSTLCPCLNFGASRHGCASSQVADGAKLVGTGRPSTNTVVLTATSVPTASLTVFLQGSSNEATGSVFGDGLRCAAGTLTRLYTRTAVGGTASAPDIGDPAIPERSALLGDPIAPGDTRYYQAYYRDPDLSFCTGSGFNVTNALLIGW